MFKNTNISSCTGIVATKYVLNKWFASTGKYEMLKYIYRCMCATVIVAHVTKHNVSRITCQPFF